MERIKDTIQAVFKNWGAQRQRPQDNPEAWLKSILTRRELGHIRVNYFKKGVLGVSVDSSSWLYHLGLKKEDILSRLRQKIVAVRDIRLFIGEVNGKEKNKTRQN
jgi:hypothetical protein